MTRSLHLIVRRVIRAPAARLFDAWTKPEQLRAWWGPAGVRCTHADIDLRVGGHYAIANEMPAGAGVIWIEGEFLEIQRPERLVYSWRRRDEANTPDASLNERVIVTFTPQDAGTEVRVVHQRIANAAAQSQHQLGWQGCLDGLVDYIAS